MEIHFFGELTYCVVTEGLRGRTMFGENGWFPERDGLGQFGPIFASHLPLDVVGIMLGTNDLNSKTRHTPEQITATLHEYVKKMKFWCEFMKYEIPRLLILAPPEIDEPGLLAFKEIFEDSIEQTAVLRGALAAFSKEHGYEFLDSSKIVRSYGEDGIHLNAEENRKLGTALAQVIRTVA